MKSKTETPDVITAIIKSLQRENSDLRMKIAFAEAEIASRHTEDFKNVRLMFEGTANILFSLDFDKQFAYASTAFMEKIGIGAFETIRGKYYKDILKKFISDKNLMRLSGAINFAKTQSATIPIDDETDHLGVTRSYTAHVAPMINESYVITGVMVMFNDITEIRKALEAAKPASKPSNPAKNQTNKTPPANATDDSDKFSLLPIILEAKAAAENFERETALEIISIYASFVFNTETDELLQQTVAALENFDCETALEKLTQLEKNLK